MLLVPCPDPVDEFDWIRCYVQGISKESLEKLQRQRRRPPLPGRGLLDYRRILSGLILRRSDGAAVELGTYEPDSKIELTCATFISTLTYLLFQTRSTQV